MTPWTVTLGTNEAGVTRTADLSRAPHILACGTSGSGKSVGINALIAGLVTAGTPQDTQIVIGDVKRVEFGIWRDAPHVASVVTDRDDIAKVILDTVETMDQRYAAMERAGIVDIEAWHGTRQQLPRLFLIIDECADLTMSSRVKAENLRAATILGGLTRVAQLGRAAGVHLILATQRPDATVLPGILRANLGTRWAFRVRTRAESRIALDAPGAETLGQDPGTSLLSWRGAPGEFIQGTFVSRSDIESAVNEAQALYGRARRSVRPVGGRGGIVGGMTHALGRMGSTGRVAVAVAGVGYLVTYVVRTTGG